MGKLFFSRLHEGMDPAHAFGAPAWRLLTVQDAMATNLGAFKEATVGINRNQDIVDRDLLRGKGKSVATLHAFRADHQSGLFQPMEELREKSLRKLLEAG